ncbi:hypothetical protein EVAR_34625_1 [Eumeta japonica]|uniref:Uncharacterized protein n=1 Tax=Eumeta variegata TaxID=151549 RepID=A0A4C1VG30_EUMVA|nr:hypothetical protein EVAR_34625_1 [Eumeta japonica]
MTTPDHIPSDKLRKVATDAEVAVVACEKAIEATLKFKMIISKATARQLEELLKHIILELKSSRASCEQLLQESEVNEKEIVSVLDKNKQMRSELAELHYRLMDTREERDQLQLTVDGFDRTSGHRRMPSDTLLI